MHISKKRKIMTMITKTLILFFLFTICIGSVIGQERELSDIKNHVFVLGNLHVEKRGTDKYAYDNPDFAIGYERQFFRFGESMIYGGIRTGIYREYVLTGDGWIHPEKNRFFLGISPSYMLNLSRNVRFQVNLLFDVLFPDDYDETWSYWAIEPSLQYFIKNFYLGISATRGVFLFFDPRAHMAKAGLKVGMRF
jgi:hypothetical protein